jgi:hypothetical protein
MPFGFPPPRTVPNKCPTFCCFLPATAPRQAPWTAAAPGLSAATRAALVLTSVLAAVPPTCLALASPAALNWPGLAACLLHADTLELLQKVVALASVSAMLLVTLRRHYGDTGDTPAATLDQKQQQQQQEQGMTGHTNTHHITGMGDDDSKGYGGQVGGSGGEGPPDPLATAAGTGGLQQHGSCPASLSHLQQQRHAQQQGSVDVSGVEQPAASAAMAVAVPAGIPAMLNALSASALSLGTPPTTPQQHPAPSSLQPISSSSGGGTSGTLSGAVTAGESAAVAAGAAAGGVMSAPLLLSDVLVNPTRWRPVAAALPAAAAVPAVGGDSTRRNGDSRLVLPSASGAQPLTANNTMLLAATSCGGQPFPTPSNLGTSQKQLNLSGTAPGDAAAAGAPGAAEDGAAMLHMLHRGSSDMTARTASTLGTTGAFSMAPHTRRVTQGQQLDTQQSPRTQHGVGHASDLSTVGPSLGDATRVTPGAATGATPPPPAAVGGGGEMYSIAEGSQSASGVSDDSSNTTSSSQQRRPSSAPPGAAAGAGSSHHPHHRKGSSGSSRSVLSTPFAQFAADPSSVAGGAPQPSLAPSSSIMQTQPSSSYEQRQAAGAGGAARLSQERQGGTIMLPGPALPRHPSPAPEQQVPGNHHLQQQQQPMLVSSWLPAADRPGAADNQEAAGGGGGSLLDRTPAAAAAAAAAAAPAGAAAISASSSPAGLGAWGLGAAAGGPLYRSRMRHTLVSVKVGHGCVEVEEESWQCAACAQLVRCQQPLIHTGPYIIMHVTFGVPCQGN